MEGLEWSLVAGVVASVAAYVILTLAARERARIRGALGLIAEPAGRVVGIAPARIPLALGALVPPAMFDPLGGAPRFARAVPEATREQWRRIARGLGLVVALAIFLAALAWSPLWLIAIFAVPWLSRVLVERELARRATRERGEVAREVTGAVDVFVLALEAGLPFERALAAYADLAKSPLGSELQTAVRELEVGYRRREVLDRVVERTRSTALAQLARSIRLAEDFGTPLASALRSLAVEMRTQRRQRLQEAALRAPVTMLLPTAAFILVPIFVIVLGPVAIRVFSGTLF